MRLPQKIFRIDTYISPDEAYHFTRKEIPLDPPLIEHSHDFFELLMVEQGAVHHWINGLEERLEAGTLVFLRPSDRHALQSVPGATARILNVMFRADTAAHLVERYGRDLGGRFFWSERALPMTLHLEGPQRERAVNAMLTLDTAHRSLARIEHFLLSVMTHVLDTGAIVEDSRPRMADPRLPRSPRAARVPAGRGGVSGRRRPEPGTCLAARHAGISASAPRKYVNRIRIQHAAMLLAGTDRDIAGVARDCGFENLSYFHRLFRHQYGSTPRGYRLRHVRRGRSEA